MIKSMCGQNVSLLVCQCHKQTVENLKAFFFQILELLEKMLQSFCIQVFKHRYLFLVRVFPDTTHSICLITIHEPSPLSLLSLMNLTSVVLTSVSTTVSGTSELKILSTDSSGLSRLNCTR